MEKDLKAELADLLVSFKGKDLKDLSNYLRLPRNKIPADSKLTEEEVIDQIVNFLVLVYNKNPGLQKTPEVEKQNFAKVENFLNVLGVFVKEAVAEARNATQPSASHSTSPGSKHNQ